MKEKFKIGDSVQLKIPHQGRRFAGKVSKFVGDNIRVVLPNGMYAEFPAEKWEITERED